MRPNITCSIQNSTSIYQIIGSDLYSDSAADSILIGGSNCSATGYLRKFNFFSGSNSIANTNWQCLANCKLSVGLGSNTTCLYYQTAPSCPSSTFTTLSGCIPCDSRCQVCGDYTNKICSSCSTEFQYYYNQVCDCGVGKFISINTSGYPVCSLCNTGCFECSGSSTNCISCNPGYYLSGTSCILCSSPCSTCFSTSSGSCLSCLTSNFLQTNYRTCSSTCPATTVSNSNLRICQNWTNIIKDLDYDTAIWNNSLWSVNPSFNTSNLPKYSTCNSVIIFGGYDKFEYVSSINRTFSLPSHNRIYIYATLYALNSGWGIGDQIQLYLNQILGLSIFPNNTIAGTNLCNKGNNDTKISIALFAQDNSSNLDIKFSQPSLSSTRSFGVRNLTILTKLCNDSCYDCSGPNLDDCNSCIAGYYSLVINSKTQCLADCPNGYLKNTSSLTCLGCLINSCSNCSANRSNCSQCFSGTYLLFGTCYSMCPLGYGQNSTSGNCEKCLVSNCTNCSLDSTNCSKCITNSFLLFGLCYTNCPNYYANNLTLGICQPCSANCLQCASDGKNCSKCDSSSYLLNGTCYTTCPSGYFGNATQGKCLNCLVSSCSNCSNDIANCTSCVSNTYLLWGSCYSICPLAYGKNLTSGMCSPCTSNSCLNCLNDPTNCTECITNNFLIWGSCGSTCPSTYGKNSTLKRCIKCNDQNCFTCAGDGNNCTQCSPTTFLYNTLCYNPCPSKFTGNSTYGKCIACNDSRCDNCSSDSFTCYKCNSTSYILAGACYGTCPRNYYGNTTNKTCLSCNQTCAYCSGSAYNDCTSCETGYYSLNISSKVQCVLTCPQKYSANTTIPYKCVPCQDPNCLSCSSDGKNCTQCNSTTFLLWGSCYSVCPLGYGRNLTSGNCSPCFKSFCSNCSIDPTNCTVCLTNYFLLWGNCSSTCPDFYGTNTTYKACIKCLDVNCTVCNVRPTNCTKCTPATFLLNSSCYSNCPITYTGNSTYGTCLKCNDSNCNYCTTNTQTCLLCSSNTYILNGKCYLTCPVGYWGNQTNMTCMPCDTTCRSCTGPLSTNCSSCSPGAQRWLFQNTCMLFCPSLRFYPDNNTYTCSACHPSCYSCSNNRSNTCTSCISPRYFLNNACLTRCPSTYYPNNSISTCVRCSDPSCLWCNNTATQCDKCIVTSKTSLYLNACIPQCPNGFYSDNSQLCNICESSCYTCIGGLSTNCTACNGTKYFYNITNECLDNCPNGYYSNSTDNKCYNCKKNCLKCYDDTNTNCTLCANSLNYYQDLYFGCWLAVCGDGRKLGPSEACDDSNLMNGDGCDSSCKIERGWHCSEQNNYTLLSACNTTCGDSIQIAKNEPCDDGNLNDEDGCDSFCNVEDGYFCYGGGLYSASICTCEPINSTVSFAANWESIYITYPVQLTPPSLPNPSSTLCDSIFESTTTTLFGLGYSCTFLNDTITIDLGSFHKMDTSQIIKIIPGSFSGINCPQNPKSIELTLSKILPGDLHHLPNFDINASYFYRICEQNIFSVISVSNFGKREYTLEWDIAMSNPIDTSILTTLKLLSNQFKNSAQMTLNKLILLPSNSYIITALITPFWGKKSLKERILYSPIPTQVRNPTESIVCKNPSLITLTTIPSARRTIILEFDRQILNSSAEILENLDITINPDYSSSDFIPYFTNLDSNSYNLTFDYKESIFKKTLNIKIKDRSKLLDIYANSFVGPDTYSIALLNFDVYTSSQITSSQTASQTAAASVVAAVIPIIMFGSGPFILSFLNGAQVVNYLRFVNIYYPVNVETFLKSFNNINFNFIPNFLDIILDFPVLDQESPFRFDSLKISSMFLVNAGGIVTIFIGTYLAHKLIQIASQVPIKFAGFQKTIMKINRFMIYNGYLLAMDSTYYQQSLSIFLQYNNISATNTWNIASIFLCLIETVIYFGYFIMLYQLSTKKEAIYYTKHSAIMRKMRVLFEDYDLRSSKTRSFAIVICLRKMIHCIILVFLHDFVWFEILLLVLMNLSFIMALSLIRPYFNFGRLKRELFIEFAYLICHIFVGLMYFYEYDSDFKYSLGWGVVAGSMGIIGVYLYDGIQMSYEKGKAIYRKIRDFLWNRLRKRGLIDSRPASNYLFENSTKKRIRPLKFPKMGLQRQMTPFFRA